ncbi:MAG: sulfatase [Flavobacteriaceae bacterium]|jgi:arylsulfatase|nr:sulfatase [Flavobacteriaceae bacterium]
MKNYVIISIVIFFTACSQNNSIQPPNIIFILTDDQGYGDLGIYGAEDITTPHLDQMAKEGAYFTSYYATQPVCSASRASILTGCYPDRIGIHNAYSPGSKVGLNPDETTIAELLKERGYKTGIFGKWHLGDAPKFLPRKHGFDEFYGILYSNDMWPKHPQQGSIFNFPEIYLYENETPLRVLEDQTFLTGALTRKAIEFIKRNKKDPFFVYLPHPQPHVPLFAGPKFQNTQDRGLYGDVIGEIDDSVGQILSTLKKEGLDENTIVVFTSDNGPWLSYGGHAGSAGIFREGKGTNWEGGHRVPGIVRYPKSIQPNTRIDAPAMGIDWLPTLVEFTKSATPNKKIDGASLVPLLTGETTHSPHENFFFYYRTNELHAVRHKDWKLYVPHTYRSLNGREATNDGFPVPYDRNEVKMPELYDLSLDPEEQNNLANIHPEWVFKITKIADSVRAVLGDRLTGIKGTENRPVGLVD